MVELCPFCVLDTKPIAMTAHQILIASKYAVADGGHFLVISKRHVSSCYDLNQDEWAESVFLITKAKEMCEENNYTGTNVGFNDGKDSGQTIMHSHFHVIGRKKNDVNDARGGIRNVIPNKGNYHE